VETNDAGEVRVIERWREELLPSCAPPTNPGPLAAAPAAAPGPAAAPPPAFNSKPDATAVLYVDFDGEPETTYPDWPESNPGGVSFACAESSLSTNQMLVAMQIIAEDYAPFNINVTTDVNRYNAPSALGRRMRCIVTPTDTGNPGGAGVAWLHSFRPGIRRQSQAGEPAGGIVVASDVPCWVPTIGYNGSNRHRVIAHAVAHEFGHTLGLSHDGPGRDGYYPGHGTEPNDWAPIMGNYRDSDDSGVNIVQWSKGEYANANNTEDDLAIISGTDNGFGYRDDESVSYISAVDLNPDGTQSGVISDPADYDYFGITTEFPGTLSVTVTSAVGAVAQARNLDIGLQLLDAIGEPILAVTPGDSMDATISTNLPPGRYYLRVFGTGYLTASDGYTDYGSLGAYLVSATLPADTVAPTATITSPLHEAVLDDPTIVFQGTASDNDRLADLAIFLRRDVDDAWWNGSYWQIGVAGASLARSYDGNTGEWQCTAPLPPVGGTGVGALTQGSYTFIVVATDPAGLTTQADSTVTVDGAGPDLVVMLPASGATLGLPGYTFEGLVGDTGGISQLPLYLRRDSDGHYWNGTGWQPGAAGAALVSHLTALSGPELGISSWICTSPLPQLGTHLAPGGSYTFIAIAVDNLANQTQADSIVVVDNTPPVATMVSPAPGAVLTTPGYALSASATDNSGVQRVVFFIRRSGDGLYWDGSSWVGDPLQANLTSTYQAGSGLWQCNRPLPLAGSTLANGSYTFIALAFDHVGRTHQSDAAVVVDYYPTYTWAAGTGSWDDPLNWSPAGIPGPGDIVVLDNGARVDVAGSRTLHALRLSAGTLNFVDGPGPDGILTTTSASSEWTGGALRGEWRIEPGAELEISGPAIKYFGVAGTLVNRGLVRWSGGHIYNDSDYGLSPGAIHNLAGGVFEFTGDGTFFDQSYFNSGGFSTFHNESRCGAAQIRRGGRDPAAGHDLHQRRHHRGRQRDAWR
jgi:hypothetical protein